MELQTHEETVQQLIATGKTKGFITTNDVSAALAKYELSTPQMEEIFEQFAKEGIELTVSDVVLETITDPDDNEIVQVVEPLALVFVGQFF